MSPSELDALIARLQSGAISAEYAKRALQGLHDESLGFAHVDHHRALRQGAAEVIYGAGKTPPHVAAIAKSLLDRGANVLCTRTDSDAFEAVREAHPTAREHARFHANAKIITVLHTPPEQIGRVAIVCAGTSDLPVADEAAIACEVFGIVTTRFTDVGVAGLHRLAGVLPQIREHDACIVIAGMEGALASVIGGQVATPVIAVPTSVGYGAALGGITALLGMLTSCASGIVVVNIDNGFGAAAAALRMLQT
jgi:pyridinium-3,5-biscarboxylic acid mononucleotide synthase